MQSMMLLIQAVSQDVALYCCAMFAGACCYVSLVEQPTIVEGGLELTDTYTLLARPRPTIFQTSFAVLGAMAGMLAGVAGRSSLWVAGGLILAAAALFQLVVVIPETRRQLEIASGAGPGGAAAPLRKMARLNAVKSLLGLATLFLFILAI